MPRWTSLKVWSRLSEKLSVSVGREFEKAVLPWLQIIWPGLTRPPEIGYWDKRGIDLVVWKDEIGLDVVVQCKGYEVAELGNAQLVQAKRSITKFREYAHKAKKYILIYNRPGNNREFHSTLERSAQELVSLGLVEVAEIWSREKILKQIFDATARRIDAQLLESAYELRIRIERLSDLHLPFIKEVPIRVSELKFKRDEPCEIIEVMPLALKISEQLLLEDSGYRWTLVVGNFGAGKTTAVLQASAHEGLVPIYVSAKALDTRHLRSGTSHFLTEILRCNGLFDVVNIDSSESPEIETILEKLAGSILGYFLRQPDSAYVLILDALDENRAYCNIEGIQHLSNQLAEFRCRTILTTRREQLAEQFGNFGIAMGEASVKYGPNRRARLLELECWTPDIIMSLLDKLLTQSDYPESTVTQINRFTKLVDSGNYKEFYGDLPLSPLFLSFILEDIVEFGVRTTGRRELINRWVARKIRRDRASASRLSPDDELDVNCLIDRIFVLLRECAGAMIEESSDKVVMTETIKESIVLELASQIFRKPSGLLQLLLNSVLVPVGYRSIGSLNVGFVYQVLQEHYLAEYWVNKGWSPVGLPLAVRTYCEEYERDAQ